MTILGAQLPNFMRRIAVDDNDVVTHFESTNLLRLATLAEQYLGNWNFCNWNFGNWNFSNWNFGNWNFGNWNLGISTFGIWNLGISTFGIQYFGNQSKLAY